MTTSPNSCRWISGVQTLVWRHTDVGDAGVIVGPNDRHCVIPEDAEPHSGALSYIEILAGSTIDGWFTIESYSATPRSTGPQEDSPEPEQESTATVSGVAAAAFLSVASRRACPPMRPPWCEGLARKNFSGTGRIAFLEGLLAAIAPWECHCLRACFTHWSHRGSRRPYG